jgi:phosphatidylinositol alpha-mannosyltransferase
VLFIGQAVERKGLPVLLRAFEALRDHVPARLTLVGPTQEEIAPLLLDDRGVTALGKVDDDAKERLLARADVLCAPSLGGESFGMVLTEAFAHGTPVVASDIAGYRDVLRDGVDGVLVPRGDATAVAAALRDLALDPQRRHELGAAARERAERYAWPRVAADVVAVYEDALRAPVPDLAVRAGARQADGAIAVLPRRLPSLEPATPRTWTALAVVRRAALVLVALAALAGSFVALKRIGVDAIATSLLAATPTWVLAALAVMGASMLLRAEAWTAILRAALPRTRVRRADAMQGTFIGVLMSATLPARLGEPSRALVVARRLGRARENLPVVLGTIVSQTLLNIVALAILGLTMISTVDVFRDNGALVGVVVAPVIVLFGVLIAPAILRARGTGQIEAALAQLRSGLRVFREPRLGLRAAAAQLSAWALQALSCYMLLVALVSTTARASAPRRPCSSPSTSPRSSRRPRRTSASSRPPAWSRSARTASARPTRWPTGSSCRPSRSPPRWPWARPPWSRRGSPGGRSACARCTLRPSPSPRWSSSTQLRVSAAGPGG